MVHKRVKPIGVFSHALPNVLTPYSPMTLTYFILWSSLEGSNRSTELPGSLEYCR